MPSSCMPCSSPFVMSGRTCLDLFSLLSLLGAISALRQCCNKWCSLMCTAAREVTISVALRVPFTTKGNGKCCTDLDACRHKADGVLRCPHGSTTVHGHGTQCRRYPKSKKCPPENSQPHPPPKPYDFICNDMSSYESPVKGEEGEVGRGEGSVPDSR